MSEFISILERIRPGYKVGGLSFRDQGIEPLSIARRNEIKKKFPNKKLNFKKYKFGMPKTDPDFNKAQYDSKARKQRTARDRKDPEFLKKRKASAKAYYAREKENILQRLYDKYRSDTPVGKTGKTLKQLSKERNAIKTIKAQEVFGSFPTGYTTSNRATGRIAFFKPDLAVWHDLYRSSQVPGQERFILQEKFIKNVPINNLGRKSWATNNYYKKIKFIDRKTGEIIKLDDTIKGKGKTLKQYLNTTIAKETGTKNVYQKSLDGYKLKDKIKDLPIKYKGKQETVGNIFAKTATDKRGNLVKSAFEVHHPYGVKNNWWNNQVALIDSNRNLNYINNKLSRVYKKATNEAQKNKILKQFGKEVDKQPGGISLFFEGKQVGTRTPTPQTLLKEGAKFYKNPALIKAIRGAGKIIKPLGIVTGLAAVNTAVKAGEKNPFDLAAAYVTADPEVATESRRIRQEPEFKKQYMAGLPQIQPEGFEMMEEQDFTSFRNGGIVAVKGVI
tara:strand:+ start:246 stop:1751 length:1506 start_codon:yes stop_codon:yes gene_type:complete